MHPTDDLTTRGLLAVARALTAPPRAKPTWITAMREDTSPRRMCDAIRALRAMNEAEAGLVEALKAMD